VIRLATLAGFLVLAARILLLLSGLLLAAALLVLTALAGILWILWILIHGTLSPVAPAPIRLIESQSLLI